MNFKRGIRVEFEGAHVEPITDLRIAFDASKSDGTKLNKLDLTIYNMNFANYISSPDTICKPLYAL